MRNGASAPSAGSRTEGGTGFVNLNNKHRLGRQRGAKVARIEIARQLAEAIWHVLTKNEPFAPASPAILLVA